ncbi:MAG TPA: hypothetical protein VKE69_00870, partial [Planctomycetota bacterium]|nr:hypothetical protein [Planctomycetota bacterium]
MSAPRDAARAAAALLLAAGASLGMQEPAAASRAARAPLPIPSLVASGPSALIVARGAEVARVDLEGRALRTASPPRMEKVCGVALSPDGKRVAVVGGVAAKAGEVAVVDAETLEVVASSPEPLFADLATAVAWSDDGASIVAGASDRVARALDAKTLAKRAELAGHTGPVLAVAVRGARIATGSSDRTVRLWDSATGKLERTLTNHAGSVTALVFEPGGSRLVSAGEDRTVRLWDPATGRLMRILREPAGIALSLVWPSGGALASGWSDGTVRWVDPEEGRFAAEASSGSSAWLYALAAL